MTELIRNQYGDAADGVFDYFEDTYIGRFRRNAAQANPNFPIQMWNMFHQTHEELPCTNNHIIAGWHRKFQSIYVLSSNLLEVYKFIEERANLEKSGYGTS